ncbi:MAG: dTDP-4-dehydrorhamnose 3,5-epimerase [Myxococcota bacterium]
MSFTFTPTDLPEVLLVDYRRFEDDRGFFSETYRAGVFAEHGIPPLVQDNHARSTKGVLRGLHFQNDPAALGKLVRCTRGRLFDVAVDLRRGSPRWAKWVSVELFGDDNRWVWIPPGFAHGYCTLSDEAEVQYKQSVYYAPDLDRSVAWNDPEIGVRWPVDAPIMSAKDVRAPLLAQSDVNFRFEG